MSNPKKSDQEGWDLVAKSWVVLESHGFAPEACDYLPDAIDNAITCMAQTREDLIKQRDAAQRGEATRRAFSELLDLLTIDADPLGLVTIPNVDPDELAQRYDAACKALYASPAQAAACREAMGSLALKIAEKISQLRHYPAMDLRWVNEAFASATETREAVNETEVILDAINDHSPRVRSAIDRMLYHFNVWRRG